MSGQGAVEPVVLERVDLERVLLERVLLEGLLELGLVQPDAVLERPLSEVLQGGGLARQGLELGLARQGLGVELAVEVGLRPPRGQPLS